MWLLFQCAIMIAVGWTGIYYQWTPNPYVLGIVSVGAAWLATWIVNKLIEFRLVGIACLLLAVVGFYYAWPVL